MEYTVTLTNIKWIEVDVNHYPMGEQQPRTPKEAKSIIEHYFSSSDIFDEEEERERTVNMVAMYGIQLWGARNLLASSLKISIKQTGT